MNYPLSFTGILSMLVLAVPLGAEPVITEFMASNSVTLADGDGNFPDWIEIHNPDPATANLAGWGLRDSLETWLFPVGTSIPPGGYLVVFASGQTIDNYIDAGGKLHTTFKLNAAGEPLALLRPDNSVAFEYAPVPSQREDIAYGLLTQVDTFVAPDSIARHWVPDATLTSDWIQAGYNDAAWTLGKAAVGYNTAPGPVLDGGSGLHTAYLVETGTPGNQSYGGALGMDFEVLEEVRVTDLGVFDAGSDGLSLTITAQLWSRSGNSGVAVLADETFTPGDPGTLEGGSRFKQLGAPLVLPPGTYTMVAYGYGSAEPNGNQGAAALDGLGINPAGGLLQFVGGSRYGTAGSFPGTVDTGPANRYGAGTFKFSPNAANDVETDVEATMRNVNAGIVVRASFDVADPDGIDSLNLEVGLDDGFVAWVNGVEIARHHAPTSLAWDSAATAEENDTLSFPTVLPPGTLMASGNVLAIQGLNVSAADGDFIVAPTLSGITSSVSSARFFTTPTPGQPNDPSGIIGFVGDTTFSIDRGFYDTPIAVAVTSATPGATIRYTTDGSTPTETHGTIYTAPITISSTTVLRAVGFMADFESTNVDTQSYLFPNDVAVQGNPAGYPGTWGPIAADYAMDPDPADYSRAAGDAAFTPAQARAALVASLKAIPTISIVTDQDNLFDPSTGIYLNPSGRGEQWERPVSVEVIGGDGIGRYQTNAGLRIMGFTSRNLSTTPKLNMRLLFKKEYGDAKMQHPILGPEGPSEFNTITLRGNIRDAWVAEASGFGSATYIGDEWAKRSQFAMNQPAVRGMFAHVYLNGIYWGLYNPTERPDDDFAETYLGGDRTEYDVVKFCCPDRAIAGSTAVWDDLLAEAGAGLSSTTAYQRIQGNNPDGSPNPAYPVLIDVDNFIDYLINGHYHAQQDWPGNYYVIRDLIEGRTEGFKFLTWDNDIPFAGGNPNGGNKVQTGTGGWWTDSPGEIDIPIRTNLEYRLRFADRAYKHYHHGGAMTAANNITRWEELATHVRPALFAESARWGDAKASALRTVQDHWDGRNANMVTNYFPNRQAVVFSQMRAHNLYPDLDTPELNQHGGIVPSGFEVYFSAGATIYYTTDGSDPRLTGGAISPAATGATSGVPALTLTSTTQVRARTFDGIEWSALNEATFIVGVPPSVATLVVSEIMYQPSILDSGGEFIELMNISATDTLDLTGVHFSDGITFAFPLGYTLGPGERAVLVADPVAFAAAHPGVPIAGTYSLALSNGGERIALADSTLTDFLAFTYEDTPPWPTSPDGGGPSLVLIAPETAPDHDLAINWRASTSNGGNPGETDRVPYPGGDLLSYAFASSPQFDLQTMTYGVFLQPGADDVEVIPQWSADLENWNEDRFTYLGGDPAKWQVTPLPGESRLFLRFRLLAR